MLAGQACRPGTVSAAAAKAGSPVAACPRWQASTSFTWCGSRLRTAATVRSLPGGRAGGGWVAGGGVGGGGFGGRRGGGAVQVADVGPGQVAACAVGRGPHDRHPDVTGEGQRPGRLAFAVTGRPVAERPGQLAAS